MIVSAFLVNRARPPVEIDQSSASLVRASGKCVCFDLWHDDGRTYRVRTRSAVARQAAASWFDKILSGAPPIAPLLLSNLAPLAGIGLWALYSMIAGQTETREQKAEGGRARVTNDE